VDLSERKVTFGELGVDGWTELTEWILR